MVGFGFNAPVTSDMGAPPRCNCFKVQGLCNATVRLTETNRQKQASGNLVTVRVDTTTDTQHCARVDYAAHHDATSLPQARFTVLTEGAYSDTYSVYIDSEDIRLDVSGTQCRICLDSKHDKEEQDLSNDTAPTTSGQCEMQLTGDNGRTGKYSGQCVNGVPNGHGTYISDGNQYTGGWLNGLWHGRGKTTTSDGGWCENEFRNDMRDGPGICVYPDGSWYKGGFKNDACHGNGSYTDASGKRITGYWENGDLVR